MTYTLYTKSNCLFCTVEKKSLIKDGEQFVEVSLDDPVALASFKARYPDQKSVPFLTDDEGNRVIRKH
jgi:glutaredoxin